MAPQRNTSAPSARRRTITEAVSSLHLAHLTLAELRAYRAQLMAEEDKVSYWRRLAHARIDVLEAESQTGTTLSMKDLVRVLGDTATGHSRNALQRVAAAEPLPDLPVLSEMWLTEVDPSQTQAVAEALDRLRAAERQLADYRRALHARIDEATGDLISRYRENPASALAALPQP